MTDAPADDLAEIHRLALKRVREVTMDVLERLHARSLEPEADLGEAAARIAGVARAVRHTIALEARLADDVRRRAEAEERAEDPQAWQSEWLRNPPWPVKLQIDNAQQAARRIERKLASLSLIRRVIERLPSSEREQFDERLFDREDCKSECDVIFTSSRTVAQVVQHICGQIGLDPDWAAFTERDWRITDPQTRAALTEAEAAPAPPPAELGALEAAIPPSQTAAPAPDRRPRAPPASWLG